MIIFDLDGTLADCEHRRHFVDPKKNADFDWGNGKIAVNYNGEACDYKGDPFKPDWKAFYEACDQDVPIDPVRYALEHFYYNEDEIQIWSGRCESVREKTVDWINRHLGGMKRIKELKMRPIGDNTPDDQLKERWLDEEISKGNKIDFVFDDRKKVVRMWRRRGIFVFNCCQNDEEF